MSSALGNWMAPTLNKLTSDIASPLLRNAINGGITGTASGFILGIGFSIINGDDFKTALGNGAKGAGMGLTIGTIGGVGAGVMEARQSNVSLLTGRNLTSKTPTYDFTPDPYGDNVTLYRGTTGSENDGGFLFMTDDPNYARSYVKNGGQVVEVTMPRSTLTQMLHNGDVGTLSGYSIQGNSTVPTMEYRFMPTLKSQIVNHFTIHR